MDITPWPTILDAAAGSIITPILANDPAYQNEILQKQGRSTELPNAVKYHDALNYGQKNYGLPLANVQRTDFLREEPQLQQRRLLAHNKQGLQQRDARYPYMGRMERQAILDRTQDRVFANSNWPDTPAASIAPTTSSTPATSTLPRSTWEQAPAPAPTNTADPFIRYMNMPLPQLVETYHKAGSPDEHALMRRALDLRTASPAERPESSLGQASEIPRRTMVMDSLRTPEIQSAASTPAAEMGRQFAVQREAETMMNEAQQERQALFEQRTKEIEEKRKELETKLKQAEKKENDKRWLNAIISAGPNPNFYENYAPRLEAIINDPTHSQREKNLATSFLSNMKLSMPPKFITPMQLPYGR